MGKHLQHDALATRGPSLTGVRMRLGLAVCCAAVVASAAAGDPGSVHRKSAAIVAKRAEITTAAGSTKFLLGLSAGVRAEIFTLSKPYRVVVDLPDVAFHLPEGTGLQGNGLIAAFRFGLLAEGKARVVMDTTGPVVIKRADMTGKGGTAVELVIELASTSVQSFGSGTGGGRAAPAAKADPTPAPKALKGERAKPVILIDAGHGGIDPGAAGSGNLKEKTLVLAVAQALREQLAAGRRYDVRMTRVSDVFVSLDQRLRMSRELDADLFISLACRFHRPERARQYRARRHRLHALRAGLG